MFLSIAGTADAVTNEFSVLQYINKMFTFFYFMSLTPM